MLAKLRQQLHLAQQRMKKQADGHRREVSFIVGDLVYLKLRPYQLKSLAKRLNEKLVPRYFGPFQLTARVGAVAYRLLLPVEATIHPVFHVSQLRRVVGAVVAVSSVPPQLLDDLELQVEPKVVMGIRPSQDKQEPGF